MNIRSVSFRKPALAISALGILLGIGSPALVGVASAAQVSSRSIKMSSSAISATGQSYDVTFTIPAASGTYTMKGIIIDFCSNSPTLGNSCTAPTSFSIGSATLTNNPDSVSNNASVSGWTVSTLNSGRTFQIVNSTGVSVTGGTSVVNFSFNTVANPSTLGSFYGRIFTYTTSTPSYTAGSETGYQDYGGVAMSTANVIGITATVQEQLQFCVSTSTMTSNCSGMANAGITLGSGSPVVLGTALATSPAYTQTTTNAIGGVIVRMKNSNTCSGLSRDGGATCPIAGVGASPGPIATGSALFGMYVTPGSGNTTATSPYNGGTTNYGMDGTAGVGVNSTYGSNIFSSSGPLTNENDTLTFGAAAGNTTPAGVYSANMTFIATGTF